MSEAFTAEKAKEIGNAAYKLGDFQVIISLSSQLLIALACIFHLDARFARNSDDMTYSFRFEQYLPESYYLLLSCN